MDQLPLWHLLLNNLLFLIIVKVIRFMYYNSIHCSVIVDIEIKIDF